MWVRVGSCTLTRNLVLGDFEAVAEMVQLTASYSLEVSVSAAYGTRTRVLTAISTSLYAAKRDILVSS